MHWELGSWQCKALQLVALGSADSTRRQPASQPASRLRL
jgi:hypothetical protein